MTPNRSNRRRSNNNNNDNDRSEIRGPTSALSAFLREQGIVIPNRSRRQARERRRQQELENQQNNDTTDTASASENASAATPNSTETEPINNNENTTGILYTPPTTIRSTRSKRARDADAQSIINTASTSKKAQQQKNKKKLLSKRKRKIKKGGSDDSSDASSDSSSDSDFSSSNSNSDNEFKPGPSIRSQAGRNLILFCYQCKKRFSRPRSKDGDNLLKDEKPICPSCISGDIKPTIKRPKKNVHVPTKINPSKAVGVPSLQNICIDVVFEYIDDVEAFGDISLINMDKLAKVVCRNRALTNKTALLFLQPRLRELSLYDCTNLDIDGLKNIAYFCPNLEVLNLNYCGRINNEVLQLYKTHLPNLKSLSLGGCHLITYEAWADFFKERGQQLESFNLRHTYQFKKEAFKELLIHTKGLKHLRLSRIVTLSNDWLDLLVEYGPTDLQTLELSWPSEAADKKHILTSDYMVRVLERTGPALKELVLKGCQDMTDELLLDGILPHCHQLQHLVLEQSRQLSSNGFKQLFVHWKLSASQGYGCGLKHITIARCTQLKDDAFIALLCHSWKSLTHLNIHSLENLSSEALEVIAGGPVPNLKKIEQENDSDNGDSNRNTDNSDNDHSENQQEEENNNNSTDNNSSDNDNDNEQSPLENQKTQPIAIDENMLASLSVCSSLTYLDASFVRSMDDFVLTKLIQSCPLLKNILVWGCHQVSDIQVPLKVTLEGREMSQIVL